MALGVGFSPGRVKPRVVDRQKMTGPGFALQVADLMEGEGAAPGPSWRGAGQNQAPHPVRVPHQEVLSDHAPEGDAEDQGVVPAQGVHQPRRVVGIVGHGIRTVRFLRLAQTSLVIRHQVESPGKGTIEHVRADPKVAPGSGNEE